LFIRVQDRFRGNNRLDIMTELLAIVGPTEVDEELLEEIAQGRPGRVTLLVEDSVPEWASDESDAGRALRDRLARLLTTVERRTGAVVVGLAGSRDQLRGWRFDRIVGGRVPVAA
jgi:hypothetical protein